jgi:hypothetical protein
VIQVSRDHYPDHAEPSLAVNPRDAQNLLGASQVIGPDTHSVETFASFDGGRTWHDNGPLSLPRGANWADDTTVAFDGRGTGFVAAMAAIQSAQGLSRTARGLYIWRTDDGGRTFHGPLAVTRGQFVDHPWLAAAPAPARSGILYAAWTASAGLAFSRSLDDGRHFATPRIISAPSNGVLAPMVAAGPAGAVYVAYDSGLGNADAPDADANRTVPPARAAGTPELGTMVDLIGSTDRGQHFGPPILIGSAAYTVSPARDVYLPTSASVTADPRSGVVYVAYAVTRNGIQGNVIIVARSHTNGRTWQSAVGAGNGSPTDALYYAQPQLAVDGTGSVDLLCFAYARDHVDVLLSRSASGGARFQQPLHLTPSPFDPALSTAGSGGKHGLWWIGDYQGLAAGGGWLHPFWNDTHTGRLEIVTAAIRIGA